VLYPALFAVLLAGGADAQQGTVYSTTKISDPILSGLGVVLEDGDEFGDAVASLGDLDGEGPSVAAIAVGASRDNDGGPLRGAVYVLFLDADGGVLSHQKISATQGNFTGVLELSDEFGGAVAGLGDLDGPGPSAGALAVGAINDDDGGLNRGAVYILFLDNAGLVISHQKISATQGGFTGTLDDGDELGGAVTSLGDLDGAGPSACTLAVGAAYDDDGGFDRGAVYILFLDSGGSVLSSQKLSGSLVIMLGQLADSDNFGEDVAFLGDLDGAGSSAGALAVCAVRDDDGGLDRGAVYVLFLSSSGTILSRQKISDTEGDFTGTLQNEDGFGSAVAGLGDLDGPGASVATLAVGVAAHDGPGLDRGAIFVLFLTGAGTVLSHQQISSGTGGFGGQLDDGDEFGSGLVSLGDLDGGGPGAVTLACGVSFDDDGGFDRGAVYLMNLIGFASVGVGDPPLDGSHALGLPRPSLFRNRTTIPFRIAEPSRVRIEIGDLAGRRARMLVDGWREAGEHLAHWDGSDDAGRALAPGVYFVRMSVAGRGVAGTTKALRVR
jgi:hypothetical protein